MQKHYLGFHQRYIGKVTLKSYNQLSVPVTRPAERKHDYPLMNLLDLIARDLS